eukprot:NODE_4_length_77007_cov_1.156642.p33 type:complete len:302 gc:universal NODE_4_length_77007_cov_1.156642:16210-15305(-)
MILKIRKTKYFKNKFLMAQFILRFTNKGVLMINFLQQLFKKEGTALSLKQVKSYLTERGVEIPPKEKLVESIQIALENFEKQSASDIENDPSISSEIKVRSSGSKSDTGSKSSKTKATSQNPRKKSLKNTRTPKNAKSPASLYPYLKAAKIPIPYKKLKAMSDKDQYRLLVGNLLEGFKKCGFELPTENKTSSKAYDCDDRKWTLDICKEVGEEMELRNEVEELQAADVAVDMNSKRAKRSSASTKFSRSDSNSDNSGSDNSDETSVDNEENSEDSPHKVKSPKKRMISSDDDSINKKIKV